MYSVVKSSIVNASFIRSFQSIVYNLHMSNWNSGGGRRFHRGRGRGGHYNNDRYAQNNDTEQSTTGYDQRSEGRRGRGRGHPSGLRGKDIGLWHARNGVKKQQERERNDRQVVHMDQARERHISQLLHSIQSNNSMAPQPSRTYKTLPDTLNEDSDTECAASQHYGSRQGERSSVSRENIQLASTSGLQSERHLESEASLEGEDEECEMYFDEEPNDFLDEFMLHNAANRMSHDRFSDEMRPEYVSPQRSPAVDEELLNNSRRKQDNRHYRDMFKVRSKLPSYTMAKEIVSLIDKNQVVVVSGETGCGKTTQVPQFILDHFISENNGSLCNIVCTQPRRISAISVAERVADERDERLGDSVGYCIRLDNRFPRTVGSMLFCTTGILLKRLESDPWLTSTSHIILDEIHERDLQSDFLLTIIKDLLPHRRDLKLVLMSATLNAEMFSQYYGNCPMVNIPGFTHPVEEFYMEDILESIRYSPPFGMKGRTHKAPIWARHRRSFKEEQSELEVLQTQHDSWVDSLPSRYSTGTKDTLKTVDLDTMCLEADFITEVIKYIVTHKGDGAILVFVPGWDNISKINDSLNRNPVFQSSSYLIIPLHSLMPTINQKQVFQRAPPGFRKIIIATNIAETSITIDDVVFVVNTGKIKLKNYDVECNVTTLQPEWVSLANSRQRRGRAGRVQPGECYHLYTRHREAQLADYQLPEMLRTSLEELCLKIKILKLGKVEPFVDKVLQKPSMDALHQSVLNLTEINALDGEEELTPLGYHIAKMPVNPQTAIMLLFAAMFGCLDPVLTLAASLGFKDPFFIPLGKERASDERRKVLSNDSMSDHIMLINAFKGWEKAKRRGNEGQFCWNNFLSVPTLRMLANLKQQFADLLYDMKFIGSKDVKNSESNFHSGNEKLVKAVIFAGLYPNVVQVKKTTKHGAVLQSKYRSDGRVKIHPKSVNSDERYFDSKWLMYHLKMKSNGVLLHDCSTISPYPILFFGGKMKTKVEDGQFCIVVDDWMVFASTPRIASLVKELKQELDRLLEYKITHPGVTIWNEKDKEGALMRAIIDLITTEELQTNRDFM